MKGKSKRWSYAFAGWILLFAIGNLATAETGKIAPSAREICPLLPGDPAPDASFKTLEGADFKLSDALFSGPVVLIFYRGGW